MVEKFQFRSLEQELLHGLLAEGQGHHDLVEQFVSSNGMNSPLASRHEGFHDELLLHTPFGWLQRSLAQFVRTLPIHHRRRKLAELSLALTIEESRTAHETYATYLSVKSFGIEKQTTLLNRHPAEYRRYFDKLADCIDHNLQSSYLQFLVAKSLVTAAFGSDIIEKISSREARQGFDLSQMDSPNARLDAICSHYDALYRDPLQHTIRECTGQLVADGSLRPRFDPYSEACWKSSREQSVLLETTLLPRLHAVAMGITRSALRLPVYDYQNKSPKAAISRLFELFARAYAHNVDVRFGKDKGDSTPNLVDELELKRRRYGDVQISNEDAITDVDIGIYANYQLDQYLHAQNIAITESLYGENEDIEWRLIVHGTNPRRIYDLDDDVLVHALETHRPAGVACRNFDVLDTVLIGVRSLDDFPSLYRRYHNAIARADRVAHYGCAFWYMGGNFIEWIDSELFNSDATLYTLSFVESTQQGQELFTRDADSDKLELRSGHTDSTAMPPRLFVLGNKLNKGYFVRLMPGHESYEIRWKQQADGELKRFEIEERAYLKSVSGKIIAALFLTWPTI